MAFETPILKQLRDSLPHGFRVREVNLDSDALSLAAVYNANAKRFGNPLLASPNDICNDLSSEGVRLQTDAVAIVNTDGAIVSWGYTWINSGEPRKIFLFGVVHPSVHGRGVGRALLTWSRARAEQLFVDDPTGEIYLHLSEREIRARRMIEVQGGKAVRYYSDMMVKFADRPTSTNLSSAPAPLGYAVMSVAEVDSEALRSLRNQCFADHWGSWEISTSAWNELVSEASMRQDQSEVVVTESGTIVAMQLTSEFPQDAATVGRVRWIGHLGVHADHRSRGLASLLIERHLIAARRDGYIGSMLSVDTDSLTGAHRLYQKLGYRRSHGEVRYQIPRIRSKRS